MINTTIETPITEIEAASLLGLKPTTLRRWRCEGRGPRFTKYGTGRPAAVRYMASDVVVWRDRHIVNS
jgi:hypothetical protein